MLIIPVSSVPNQTFSVSLSGQNCSINVYQKSTGLYLNLSINNILILGGAPCLNATLIVRDVYFGFVGDLAFVDIQGVDDPSSTGLGARWPLLYLTPTDLATGQA